MVAGSMYGSFRSQNCICLLMLSLRVNKYFFGDGGREVYDFGGDFADWYIEASKAHIYQSGDDSVALVAQTVLLYVCIDIIIYQSKQSKRESRWVLRIVKNGWSCFIGG